MEWGRGCVAATAASLQACRRHELLQSTRSTSRIDSARAMGCGGDSRRSRYLQTRSPSLSACARQTKRLAPGSGVRRRLQLRHVRYRCGRIADLLAQPDWLAARLRRADAGNRIPDTRFTRLVGKPLRASHSTMTPDNIMTLDLLDTPAAIIDVRRMKKNIASMQELMNALGVKFRPHVKTSKCLDVVQAQMSAGAQGITVSTLKEAETFFAAGITDILYAVSIIPSKLSRVMALRKQGCDLKIIVDNASAAAGIVEFCQSADESLEVWIEVDTDGHRSGITPEEDAR